MNLRKEVPYDNKELKVSIFCTSVLYEYFVAV